MKYQTIAPPPQLAPYVKNFWILEEDTLPTGSAYIHRTMANGYVELVFHYQGPFDELTGDKQLSFSSTAFIHAQSQHYRRFIVQQRFGIFGISLYPFAVPLLFSMPATELSDEMPGLEIVAGTEGAELNEKIMLAHNNRERLALIIQFLESKLLPAYDRLTRIHTAVRYVMNTWPAEPVQQLASRYCLSARQFERRFKELAGFSPKLFSRIIRFQQTLNAYGKKYHSLAEVAYDCGYYDQSHFIQDFRQFSGYHPKQYFYGRTEGIEFREV